MDKFDIGREVARVLGEVREKVSKDLDAIFESVVKDKLKSEYESNIDTNIYAIVERKTLKSLADRVEDIENRIKVANDELDDAEKSINEADIIIGHNSGSTLEALVNGKYVMVPFFEKEQKVHKKVKK